MTDPRRGEPGGFIVTLLTAEGQPAGVGLLAGPGEIVTCAHVVNVALGRDPRSQEMPAQSVTVGFPLLPARGGRTVRAGARVQRWLAPPRAGAAGDDIAGLRIDGGLPEGARPAVLATSEARAGQTVDVFGYPQAPNRPDGGWVEAVTRGALPGGRLQVDAAPGAALRIQPGYSGSPVCDRASGRVVGMLAAAPGAGAAERDAYAIGVGQLVSAWADALDPDGLVRRRLTGQRVSPAEVTVLHLSDMQFGRHHRFGGAGLTPADQSYDSLFQRLHDDLDVLAAEQGLRPDLMVVTGDLAEWGMPSEFRQVLSFLTELADAIGLPRRHVAIVPGNHDVNRAACESYFAAQRAIEREPAPPYWPKWEQFATMFAEFYADPAVASFTPDEPWSLFEMPDLRVVVAGLNSTMAESHRDGDHYGLIGEAQLQWFAERLAQYRSEGWLRLAAVHHNAIRGAIVDDENLRDSELLDQVLGEPSLINVLLHGHTHDARMHRLPSGLAVLSTGSAALTAGTRPPEVPNQYQFITLRPGRFTRYARLYAPDLHRWIGDNRVSPTGSNWHENTPYPLAATDSAFSDDQEGKEGHDQEGKKRRAEETERFSQTERTADGAQPEVGTDDLLDRVAEATRVRHSSATVTVRPDARYLRVSNPLPTGGCAQWPVGVLDAADAEQVRAFVTGIHARFAAADPQLRSELVCVGSVADQGLIDEARRAGVRLCSLVDYQGLIDLRPLEADQRDRIAKDLRYPVALYVAQRYRDPHADPDVRAGLLEQMITWLDADGPRFVMVLGDFGRGKTFLLRQLARQLPSRLPAMLPVLIELHGLEKAPSLDELLAQHLVRHGMQTVELPKLRYMIESGRLALLFDGFDELALRVSYDHAADYLQTLLAAATGNAKIVLTSRTQHFQSTAQVRTALGDRVAALTGNRIAIIEDFTDDQIREFLVNRYNGDEAAAERRFRLLDQIHDLLGLSHNPRMLSFIADLDERRLRDIQQQHGVISAAGLYEEIIGSWLRHEAGRQQYRGGLSSLNEGERHEACSALALRLWASTSPTIPVGDLSAEVAATLTELAERGYTAQEAAQAVGSGTLLVGTAEGSFTFVHPSVMEWLVAEAAARQLQAGEQASVLAARRLSRLMADFLYDLAGHDAIAVWATVVLSDAAATETAKQNALDVMRPRGQDADEGSQGDVPGVQADLADTDLRAQDLTDADMRMANLKDADLRGMRLKGTDLRGADLRRADFTGARLIDCQLADADITGSQWSRAVLTGVTGLDELTGAEALETAGVAEADPADVMLAPGGAVGCVAFSPTDDVLAIGRGSTAEIVGLDTVRTIRVLAGHLGQVNRVAFSPDGSLIATASSDGTARTWHTSTGDTCAILTGHTGPVRGVAFSPDGNLIATASSDGTARTWHTSTGDTCAILTGHTGPVWGVTFSPDGNLIATASDDHTTQTWDATTGQHHSTLTGHTGPVNAVTFSPDNLLVATASNDHTVRTWDTTTGRLRATLTGHTSGVRGVAFSPGGNLIATASEDRTVRTWDAATGWERATFTGHTDWVQAVTFSPDGNLIATASSDGTARTWGATIGDRRATFTSHTSWVQAVTFSPDGNLIATASNDGTARTWDTTTGAAQAILTGHTSWVHGVTFSPDGNLIATASDDRTVRTWDATTGWPRATLRGHTGPVRGVAFSADSSLIATASDDHTARIWDATTGQHHSALTGHTGPVNAVAFSPDTILIATVSNDHTVRTWDITKERARAAFTGHADGSLTAVAAYDHTARASDATTGRPRATLTGHTDWVRGVTFSPDGTLIATASDDHTARIWDATTGQQHSTLTGHTNWVRAVAFSPDGLLIATASNDCTARIWDATTGQQHTTLTGHTGPVRGVAFSPDGSLIATASDDGTLRMWNAAGTGLAVIRAFGNRGHAVLLPDGSYKLEGDPRGEMWWALKLVRFEPGEIHEYVSNVRRLPDDAPILPPPRNGR